MADLNLDAVLRRADESDLAIRNQHLGHGTTYIMASAEDVRPLAAEVKRLTAELAETTRKRKFAEQLERMAGRCARTAEEEAASASESEARAKAAELHMELRLRRRENQMANAIDLCEAASDSEPHASTAALAKVIANELKLHDFKRPSTAAPAAGQEDAGLAAAKHGWTDHGHQCCREISLNAADRPNTVAKCAGPGLCIECATDAERIHGQHAGQTGQGGDRG